ncbi:MAG: 1-deoxy-D-xylulose-5-phosphate reductoisomerase, partial [Elusimicrobiota bacterium]
HSMVEFIDNSIKALLSVPDMRLAIQYALTYPQRFVTKVKTLNVAGVKNFSFYEPDFKRFPCLGLALKAGKAGGTLPAVLNASNEVAVNAFLKGRIKFSDIDDVISKVMSKHRNIISPDLDDIIEVDRWARAEAQLLC